MQTGRPKSGKFNVLPTPSQNFTKKNARLSTGIMQLPKTGQSVMGISNVSKKNSLSVTLEIINNNNNN